MISFILLLPVVCRSAGPAASVYLRANPSSIIADGKSVTTITVEVRDSSGNPVDDGTLVSFSTSLGAVESMVSTKAGVARARLTSGTVTGAASVSAWVTQGGAAGQIRVECLAPGTEISRQTFITITSRDYLVMSPERMTAYASGGVKIVHKGMTVECHEAQFDLQMGVLKCRATDSDPLVIRRGDKSLSGLLLYYRTDDMKGKLLTEGESGLVERKNLRAADLTLEKDDEEISPSLFDFTDISESSMLIRASSITVKPMEEIQFHRAKVYVDGRRVVSLPLHVIPLDPSQIDSSRVIGWGPTGLRIDVPVYYTLSPTSTGSLHLRKGQQAGWGYYSGDRGWALDVVQDYDTESGAEGSFSLNRVTSSDWGASWNHKQDLSTGGSLYGLLEFPAHRDFYGTLNISKPINRLNVGVNLYGNKLQDQEGSLTSDVYLQTSPKPLAGGAINYSLLGRASKTTGGGGLMDTRLGTGLQIQLRGKPVSFSKQARLNTSLSFGQDWGGARAGFSLTGNASFNYRMGRFGVAGLVYTYSRDPLYRSQLGRHRLSASAMWSDSKKWQGRLLSTYTLDRPMSSTFIDVSYQFKRGWTINLLETIQSSSLILLGNEHKYRYSDTELGLGKKIRDHDVLVVWSKSKNRLRLDFTAARF